VVVAISPVDVAPFGSGIRRAERRDASRPGAAQRGRERERGGCARTQRRAQQLRRCTQRSARWRSAPRCFERIRTDASRPAIALAEHRPSLRSLDGLRMDRRQSPAGGVQPTRDWRMARPLRWRPRRGLAAAPLRGRG
jgi:hypothetical protein